MKTMVIDELRTANGMKKAEAELAFEQVFGATKRVLDQGHKVSVPGFGTFERKIQPERQGRNPATGEPIRIAERTVTKFREARPSR